MLHGLCVVPTTGYRQIWNLIIQKESSVLQIEMFVVLVKFPTRKTMPIYLPQTQLHYSFRPALAIRHRLVGNQQQWEFTENILSYDPC